MFFLLSPCSVWVVGPEVGVGGVAARPLNMDSTATPPTLSVVCVLMILEKRLPRLYGDAAKRIEGGGSYLVSGKLCPGNRGGFIFSPSN